MKNLWIVLLVVILLIWWFTSQCGQKEGLQSSKDCCCEVCNLAYGCSYFWGDCSPPPFSDNHYSCVSSDHCKSDPK